MYDPTAQQLIATTAPQDYLFRELVRAKNDTMYTPLMLASNDSIDYLRNGIYGRQGTSTTTGTFELASNLPTQPYRLSGGSYESEFAREVGNKQYELKDHLGNVRVVVKDIKTAFDADNDGNDDSYTASILSFNDFYPFSQTTKNRSFNDNSYKYSYGGHEKISEIAGDGAIVDMGDRWLDVRIGRTPKPDKLEKLYPGISPYSYALNNPILLTDADGKVVVDGNGDPVTITVSQNEDGTYTATFNFADRANEYTKKEFMDYGGRAIQAAIQVETGRDQVQKAIDSQDQIYIQISPALDEEEVEGGISRRFGVTQPGLPAKEGQEGENIDVYILEGSIEKEIKVGDEFEDVTEEQAVGSVLGHELEHATNKEGLSDKKEEEKSKEKGREMIKEYRDLNKEKKDE